MKLRSRKWLRGLLIASVILLVIPYFTSGCLSFRMSKKSVVEYYKDQELKPALNKIKFQTWNIHYAEIGADTLPMVIFVHGAPGSWSAFRYFLKDSSLYSRAHLVSVDRPGYGYSDYGRPATKLEEQARLIAALFKLNKSGKPAILVGHSLGGPIIARMAIDYPNDVGALIMVSPSISAELEPEEWYRLPLSLPFVRWILPASLDMTNREILHLREELDKLLPLWKNITAPTLVVQGGEDSLVSPENAEFAEKVMVNAPLEIRLEPDANHFIPWNNPQFIKEAINKYLPMLEKQ